jgi:hypothetical protein
MDKDTMTKVINIIFDTAAEFFKNKPMVVITLNMIQAVVVNTLINRIVLKVGAAKITAR